MIKKMVPDIITATGLGFGISAIPNALNHHWTMAISFLLVAIILDGMDGRAARMLKVSNQHGELLDDLCDFVNFGVVPAILMYIAFPIAWYVCLAYIFAIGFRLIRFSYTTNITLTTSTGESKRFFQGTPSPETAALFCVPIILTQCVGITLPFHDTVRIVYLIAVMLLAVSPLPVYSIKYLNLKQAMILLLFFVILGVTVSEIWGFWYFILFVLSIYLLSIPICSLRVSSLKAAIRISETK